MVPLLLLTVGSGFVGGENIQVDDGGSGQPILRQDPTCPWEGKFENDKQPWYLDNQPEVRLA